VAGVGEAVGRDEDDRAEAGGAAVTDLIPNDYGEFLEALKRRVHEAQLRASLSANRELVLLYWGIGADIRARQAAGGWGSKVVERLARDLRREFPQMQGFSPRNLHYMRAFAEAWPEAGFVQEVLARLSWYHNIAIVEKVKDRATREWYARAAFEHGWSRNVLAIQIDNRLHARRGKAITNFSRTLPPPDSDMTAETLKDPYVFDFLTLDGKARERELERGLMTHVDRQGAVKKWR
jgi:predicted nuclease of restriction endonuclease-like (RecB) superfamily